MLEDCRQAPLSIFLTLPSTIPATNNKLETSGGNITPAKIKKLIKQSEQPLKRREGTAEVLKIMLKDLFS